MVTIEPWDVVYASDPTVEKNTEVTDFKARYVADGFDGVGGEEADYVEARVSWVACM